jgi:hypothetical protein
VKEKAMDRGDKTVTETSGIQTKPIDIDVDDDSPNSVASPELEVCQANGVPVARVRRGARSRIATVEAIKEEPADMEPKMLDEKMRTGKGKKTPAKSSGSATRSSARTKKDNGSSPTPVSGTSAASEDGFDKENAPDTVEDDEQAPEKVVKIRVTRSKKTYAAKVKEEQVTEVEGGVVEPPARTRAGSRARK